MTAPNVATVISADRGEVRVVPLESGVRLAIVGEAEVGSVSVCMTTGQAAEIATALLGAVPTPNAADLPDGSVVADVLDVCVKSGGRWWMAGDPRAIDAHEVDEWLAQGATVLRVGDGTS